MQIEHPEGGFFREDYSDAGHKPNWDLELKTSEHNKPIAKFMNEKHYFTNLTVINLHFLYCVWHIH